MSAHQSKSRAPSRRSDHILFIAQRPPPVHGVTMVSQRVHTHLKATNGVIVEDLWRGGARSMGDIGTKSVGKLFGFARMCADLAVRAMLRRRSAMAYLTLTPWSHAALRDGLIAWLAGWSCARVLVHLHTEGLAQVLADNGLRARLLRRLLSGSELIAITEETAAAAEASAIFARVNRLPNTAPVAPTVTRNAAPGAAGSERNSEGVNSAKDLPLTCAYLGNYDERKGIYDFVAVIGALARDGVPVRGIITGGPSRFVTMEDLRTAVTAADAEDVITLEGFVDEARKSAILAAADLFVYPTRHDHAPLVLLEAMVHGAVPITLDAGGIRSMMGQALAHNISSHRADAASRQAFLAARIQAYASDRDALAADARTTRAHYAAQFAPEHFEARLSAIFAAAPVKHDANGRARAGTNPSGTGVNPPLTTPKGGDAHC